jgi:hypothetical protein
MPKLDIFRVNLFAVALRYVKTPSSSGNVYFANGHTDSILAPYDKYVL